jgi:hypothetical protein
LPGRRTTFNLETASMNNIPIHPAAQLLPEMTPEEYSQLVDDIAAHGQRDPVWLYHGEILDGRHRHRACLELGLEPRFQEYKGNDPIDFVISKNLHRRHLTESQRSMVAAGLAELKVGANQHTQGGLPRGTPSVAEAAEKCQTSPRSVARAKKVLKTGNRELINAVKNAKVSVHEAATVAELPDDEQKAVIEAGPKAIKAKAKEIAGKKAKGATTLRIVAAEEADTTTAELRADTESPEDQVSEFFEVLKRVCTLSKLVTPTIAARPLEDRERIDRKLRRVLGRLNQMIRHI